MTTRDDFVGWFGPKVQEAIAELCFDENNILRVKLGLPQRSKQQMIDALKTKLDSLPDYSVRYEQ